MISTKVLDFKFFYYKKYDICGPDIAVKFNEFIQKNFKENTYQKGFEYCCGNGAIGFKLLQQETIKHLTMSDINSELTETIEKTADSNGWTDKIKFVVSEKLTDIPVEKFDFIVGNPPWRSFMIPGPIDTVDKVKHFDISWKLHRQMYDSLNDYIHEASDIFIIEDHRHSHPKFWETFISDSELTIKKVYDFEFITTRKNGDSHMLDSCYIMHIKKK
jgi:methylase of polypeptide subunit release factors